MCVCVGWERGVNWYLIHKRRIQAESEHFSSHSCPSQLSPSSKTEKGGGWGGLKEGEIKDSNRATTANISFSALFNLFF